MADYIKREDVAELADDILHMVDELRSCGQLDYHAYSELFDNLCGFSTIPTADVRPVVRGRWIGGETSADADGFPVYDTFICPMCGAEWDAEEADIAFNFCPNCGADDMRVFCYGRADGMTDELLDKCRRCGALVWNETPDVGRLSDG